LNKYLQYLPFVIFAICIAIAILLTVMTPSWWPAALAIAIAGSALALAFRSQESREIGYLTDDITVLQEQNAELKEQTAGLTAEVAKNNEMIDELADIVEQITTLTAEGGDITRTQLEALRDEVTTLRETPGMAVGAEGAAGRRGEELEVRIAALEAQSSSNESHVVGATTLGLTGAAVAATAASTTDVASLRTLMARGNGEAEATEPTEDEQNPVVAVSDASLAPVFQPELGTPVAFILRSSDTAVSEDFSALLQHAIKISSELEEANRENLLFVRLSSATLEQPAVRDAVLSAVAEHPPLQRRLAILTGQQEFSDAALQTLTTIAAEGCRFGLDNVRDWSINLSSLARSGMAFILVDGPAMARSAQEQGGDPRRLAQALKMHDIALIGGEVATEEDIDAVNSLEPTFVTGEGLGEARALEAV